MSITFNWPEIKKIAAKPLPSAAGIKSMASKEWAEMEHEFRNIQLCRSLLAARHAGYLEAKPDGVNPFPPEPMIRNDDMKEKP